MKIERAKAVAISGTPNSNTVVYGVKIDGVWKIGCGSDKELAQKVAASLNLFDTLLEELSQYIPKEPEDNYSAYIIGGSWIDKVGYDKKKRKLKIWKAGGQNLVHLEVPEDVADNLIHAESVGGAYNKTVRGKYPLEQN